MGHQTHFLRRLERVSFVESDFALALYRDPGLVRYILAQIRLPPGEGRVALAMTGAPDAPHIIVARGGQFVTCLGAGMTVGDCTVVPRARIDRLRAERQGIRDAIERIARSGGMHHLYRRMLHAGRTLTREEFTSLRAVSPLMWWELFGVMIDVGESLQRFRDRYRRGHYRRKSAHAIEKLTTYWQGQWAVGHIIALLGSHLHELLEATPRGSVPALDDLLRSHVSWLASRTMSTPMVLRGAWTVARVGRHLLPAYKQACEKGRTFVECLDSTVGLAAMGLRHRRLRGEVKKILGRRLCPACSAGGAARTGPLDPNPPAPCGDMACALAHTFHGVLAHEDGFRTLHRTVGARMLELACGAAAGDATGPLSSPGIPLLREDLEELEELELVLPCQLDTHLFQSSEALALLAAVLPWVARGDIADLYLPAATQARVNGRCNPDDMLDQLDDYALYTAQSVSARRTPAPGRNQPCPCQSGRKYKRCCARITLDHAA